jgi:type II secretory pathway component GspD/PulD (secretin)
VTGYSQGYPTISQRSAETSASVRDGETFVIGGLTQDNLLTKHRPWQCAHGIQVSHARGRA